MKKHIIPALIIAVTASCSSNTVEKNSESSKPSALVRSDYSPKELKTLCDKEITNFTKRIDDLSKLKARPYTFAATFNELEDAVSDFQENAAPLTFMYSVSTNPELRAASEACDSKTSQVSIEIFSRRDLYNVMKTASTEIIPANSVDARLITEAMKEFKINGLELSDEKLKEFKNLKKQLADLSTQFHANLNNNNDFAEMNESEMVGIPETVKSRFEKLPNGNYKIPTKTTYYVAFMENASNAEARQKMLRAYDNRAAALNTPLLQKTIQLRRQAAHLIGFDTWADYRTYNKMAKSGKTAWDFLQNLKGKLRKSYDRDYQQLLTFKKTLVPGAKKIDPWDGAYFANQLKKKKYSVDDEVIREYFPAEYVVPKMFEIYSRLLSVTFVEIKGANTWHPTVHLYEIHDTKTHELLAYFYTDLYPREGKYGHAAAFTLRSGRMIDAKYQAPISAIVANMNPPTKDKPSLLSHDDVETLFHEFGHIMHQTLTRVPYSSLSGSSVAWDFVEAPSQMLENWVWEPAVLRYISSNYREPAKKLPNDLIQKMIKARKFNQAWFYTRQLMMGIYDLTLHQSPDDLDVTETYKNIYRELTGMEPMPDTHFPATFGHLMGGYDAGYYGYVWSNVFAFDMYTSFQKTNRSPITGKKYRETILEQGNLKDADQLLTDFLGRKPNSDAFFKYLGISK